MAATPGRRVYDEAVREAPAVLWEAPVRICARSYDAFITGPRPEESFPALSIWTVFAILRCSGFAGFALLYGRMLIGTGTR